MATCVLGEGVEAKAVAQMALAAERLLVHDREGSPCALCQPEHVWEGAGFGLCFDCVQSILVAAGAGSEEAWILLEEIFEALKLLEPTLHTSSQFVN